MGTLGKIVLGILGICILLPGLCFGLFGLSFLVSATYGGLQSFGFALVWFAIGGLLTWAAIAVFRQIGK